MLILSRRIGEQLLIGDDILVEVLEISESVGCDQQFKSGRLDGFCSIASMRTE